MARAALAEARAGVTRETVALLVAGLSGWELVVEPIHRANGG